MRGMHEPRPCSPPTARWAAASGCGRGEVEPASTGEVRQATALGRQCPACRAARALPHPGWMVGAPGISAAARLPCKQPRHNSPVGLLRPRHALGDVVHACSQQLGLRLGDRQCAVLRPSGRRGLAAAWRRCCHHGCRALAARSQQHCGCGAALRGWQAQALGRGAAQGGSKPQHSGCACYRLSGLLQ